MVTRATIIIVAKGKQIIFLPPKHVTMRFEISPRLDESVRGEEAGTRRLFRAPLTRVDCTSSLFKHTSNILLRGLTRNMVPTRHGYSYSIRVDTPRINDAHVASFQPPFSTSRITNHAENLPQRRTGTAGQVRRV